MKYLCGRLLGAYCTGFSLSGDTHIGVSEPIHGSILLPFLPHAIRTTGNSAVSDFKIAHSVHHVNRKLIYDCARYEALQIKP